MKMMKEENLLANYEILRTIGVGTFGEVLEAYDKKNKIKVALKKIYNHKEEGPGLQGTSLREISLLKEMCNDNIIKLRGYIVDPSNLYIALELMNKDLRSFLRELGQAQLVENRVKRYLHQILCAVAYFHKKRIFHRDLKPENILIGEDDSLRIADFGLARKACYPPRPYTLSVVTLPYRAPEVLLGFSQYTNKIDIWSIGCIFAELLTNRIMFPSSGELDQIQSIFRKMGTPDEEAWPGWTELLRLFKTATKANFEVGQYRPSTLEVEIGEERLEKSGFDLLKKMLACNPNRRISAQEALQHPYFNDYISN